MTIRLKEIPIDEHHILIIEKWKKGLRRTYLETLATGHWENLAELSARVGIAKGTLRERVKRIEDGDLPPGELLTPVGKLVRGHGAIGAAERRARKKAGAEALAKANPPPRPPVETCEPFPGNFNLLAQELLNWRTL